MTDAADFVAYFASDPATRVVGLFLETVRRPAEFEEALRLLAEAGKVAVVLKVGTSEMGRQAARAHTGAMVGDDRAFSGMLRYYNAIRVDEFGDWLEHLAVFSRVVGPRGRRIGAVTNSGGEGEYFADKAEQAGIPFQPLSPELTTGSWTSSPTSSTTSAIRSTAGRSTTTASSFPAPSSSWPSRASMTSSYRRSTTASGCTGGERELARNIAEDLQAATAATTSFPA